MPDPLPHDLAEVLDPDERPTRAEAARMRARLARMHQDHYDTPKDEPE